MKKIPRISEAEWQVMEVLWERNPRTAFEIVEGLSQSTGWKPTTVRTLLARLVRKKVLRVKAEGKRYWYSPEFTREACVADESASFLERVFRGSPRPLLLHFAEKSRLTPRQLAELKRILEEGSR